MNTENLILASQIKWLTPKKIVENLWMFAQESFASHKEVFELLRNIFTHGNKPLIDDKIISNAEKNFEKIMNISTTQNIRIISVLDDIFPDFLKNIANYPVFITSKWNHDLVNSNKGIAIVWTRNPSRDWPGLVHNLIKIISENRGGIDPTIVSGLALWIDHLSHQSALKFALPTSAILAWWLDKVSPKQNADLANGILEQNWVLISEFLPWTPSYRSNFVQRNRLQAAFSSSVVIVECEKNSWTMKTANFSLEQWKSLYAVYYGKRSGESFKQMEWPRYLVTTNKALPLWDEKDILKLMQNFKNGT